MDCTVTVISTPGIQDYIFGSNTLRENVGASEFVYRATSLWVANVLDHTEGKKQHNLKVDPERATFGYQDGEMFPAEVIYAGGGNCVILWQGADHENRAKQFVYALSQKALVEAPDLPLAAAHVGYTWEGAELSLPGAIEKAIETIEQNRSKRASYVPTLGLGVTAACASTGLPANGSHPDPERTGLASRAHASVVAKWKMSNPKGEKHSARERLQGLFDFVSHDQWTEDLDKIGRVGERDDSYIAVVHADGNAMGKRIIALGKIFAKYGPDKPRAYITAVRTLSKALQETAQNALYRTISQLWWHFINQHETGYFTFRPIVFGGDDVTWVCKGEWGLATAHSYLHYLKTGEKLPSFRELWQDLPNQEDAMKMVCEEGLDPDDKQPYACAGVAIVKTHYPFSRAYDLSEELVKSAKTRVLALEPTKKANGLDWHLAMTGIFGSLEKIRATEYTTTDGQNLTARPLLLDSSDTWRTWDNFRNVLKEFRDEDKPINKQEWQTRRNKIMALREALRRGAKGVEQFAMIRQIKKMPEISLAPKYKVDVASKAIYFEHGWVQLNKELRKPTSKKEEKEQELWLDEGGCAYFDAIEIHEMFEPLPIQHPKEVNA